MKLFGILALVCLVSFSGCEDDGPINESRPEGSWNPLRCSAESSKCDTEWNFSFKRTGFPNNVAIYVSDVKVVDECSPDGSWVSQTNGPKIEFRRDNFGRIKSGEKIDLRVMDLGDPCNTNNEVVILRKGMAVEVSDDENDRYVLVEAI